MKSLRFCACAALLGALALLLSGCSRQEAASEAVPPRAVKLMRVQAAHTDHVLDYAATIAAQHSAAQGFRVGGKILSRPVEVGQRVVRGQLLAELDASDLRLAEQAAAAQVQAAAAAAELAQSQWRRNQKLHAEGFVSAAQLEHSASAQRSTAAQLAQARAQAAAQSRQSGYARLVAEAAGVVVAVAADAGQVVGAGQPVVTIALDGARDAVFAVPESVRARLSIGQSVQLRPYHGRGATRLAHIRDVAASADAATRQFTVWARVDAAKDDDEGDKGEGEAVALGSSWRVMLTVPQQTTSALQGSFRTRGFEAKSSEHALKNTQITSTSPNLPNAANSPSSYNAPLSIAATALWRGTDGATQVWVFDADSSTVQPRRVEVAAARGDAVFIASGLSAGETIVAAGAHVLSAGERVRPWNDVDKDAAKELQQSQDDQGLEP